MSLTKRKSNARPSVASELTTAVDPEPKSKSKKLNKSVKRQRTAVVSLLEKGEAVYTLCNSVSQTERFKRFLQHGTLTGHTLVARYFPQVHLSSSMKAPDVANEWDRVMSTLNPRQRVKLDLLTHVWAQMVDKERSKQRPRVSCHPGITFCQQLVETIASLPNVYVALEPFYFQRNSQVDGSLHMVNASATGRDHRIVRPQSLRCDTTTRLFQHSLECRFSTDGSLTSMMIPTGNFPLFVSPPAGKGAFHFSRTYDSCHYFDPSTGQHVFSRDPGKLYCRVRLLLIASLQCQQAMNGWRPAKFPVHVWQLICEMGCLSVSTNAEIQRTDENILNPG